MKRWILVSTFIFIFLAILSGQDKQVELGISIADGKLQSFYLAISDFYQVPGKEVVATKERYRLPNEELPVIYFLAARAHVSPSAILDLRNKSMSWLDITFHYGLAPDIFFVPLAVKKVGPPYGRAYGYYSKYRPNKDWKKIVLKDQEVIDLVNLRFLSEHYRIAPEVVIEMRSGGNNFINISHEAEKSKAKKKGEHGKAAKGQAGKGKTKHR